jgi:hypothetical protein
METKQVRARLYAEYLHSGPIAFYWHLIFSNHEIDNNENSISSTMVYKTEAEALSAGKKFADEYGIKIINIKEKNGSYS